MIVEVRGRPGASSVPAIKNNRIYVFDAYKIFGTDGVVGLTDLAKIIHPDADLHPEDFYREYLQFLGLKLPEDRIFAYPSMEANA